MGILLKVNKEAAADAVYRQGSKIIAYEIRQLVNDGIQEADANMEQEFERHSVTQELRGGVGARNMSGTLGGYGNLFTFIGFYDGDRPADLLKNFLFNRRDFSVQKLRRTGSRLIYDVTIYGNTMDDIKDDDRFTFPDDWTSGTWVEMIEEGISGFEHYLRDDDLDYPPSRSGGGVQIKSRLRSGSFQTTDYVKKMLSKYSDRLRRIIKNG